MHLKPSGGFTLIELLIVVAVIGILAAIAYPSYLEQIRQSRRADATAVLAEASQYMERFHTLNHRYDKTLDGTTVVALPTHLEHAPQDGGTAFYDLSIQAVDRDSYTLQAVPVNAQASDACGTLSLTHTGARSVSGSLSLERCWR